MKYLIPISICGFVVLVHQVSLPVSTEAVAIASLLGTMTYVAWFASVWWYFRDHGRKELPALLNPTNDAVRVLVVSGCRGRDLTWTGWSLATVFAVLALQTVTGSWEQLTFGACLSVSLIAALLANALLDPADILSSHVKELRNLALRMDMRNRE